MGVAHGFFERRRAIDAPAGGITGLLKYPNIAQGIGLVVSERLATLHELQTVYSIEDLFSLIEILAVDSANEARIRKAAEAQRI